MGGMTKIIEWLNKSQELHPCQLPIQGSELVFSVAYSKCGTKLVRTEGVHLVTPSSHPRNGLTIKQYLTYLLVELNWHIVSFHLRHVLLSVDILHHFMPCHQPALLGATSPLKSP